MGGFSKQQTDVFFGDNFHEIIGVYFLGLIRKKYFSVSSVETFTVLAQWANSADDKLMLLFSFFSFFFLTENRIWHFMKIVSTETVFMEWQILFSMKNKISVGRLLRILPSWSTCKFSRRQIEDNFLFFSQKTGSHISWKVSHLETTFIKCPLWKHVYSNIQNILPPKTENFQIKNSDIFHTSAQDIGCGYSLEPPRRGGSNEYPQSMFSSKNKENNVYPCKPQFYYTNVGLRGSQLYRHVFVMGFCFLGKIR